MSLSTARGILPEICENGIPTYSSTSLRELDPYVTTRRLEAPLFGNDFFVTKEDFERYHRDRVAFWTELAEALTD